MKLSFSSTSKLTSGVLLAGALSVAMLGAGCSRNTSSGTAMPDSGATKMDTPPATDGHAERDDHAGDDHAKDSAAAEKTDTETPAAPTLKAIDWQPTMDAALAKAKQTQKPIMADFFATWCGPCKMLDKDVYTDARIIQESQNFISVKIDTDQHNDLAQKYNAQSLPTIVFLDSSGKEISRQVGIVGSDTATWFKGIMEQARAQTSGTAL